MLTLQGASMFVWVGHSCPTPLTLLLILTLTLTFAFDFALAPTTDAGSAVEGRRFSAA
jgi:hypothetical protein